MKFKKNDLVSINFSAFCSVFDAHNDEAENEPVEYHKVLNCRMTDTGIEYKLRGCYGWWKEEHLSLKPEEPKFSPSCEKAGGPNKDKPVESKHDTEDSGKAREVAAVNKFADKIRNYLFERIEECDNMTAEDPLWVNRLRWSSEATVIFLNECLSEFTDETTEEVK